MDWVSIDIPNYPRNFLASPLLWKWSHPVLHRVRSRTFSWFHSPLLRNFSVPCKPRRREGEEGVKGYVQQLSNCICLCNFNISFLGAWNRRLDWALFPTRIRTGLLLALSYGHTIKLGLTMVFIQSWRTVVDLPELGVDMDTGLYGRGFNLDTRNSVRSESFL